MSLQTILTELIDRAVDETRIVGASVAVVRDGELLALAGGMADRERAEAMTPGHRIRLASISKTLTAMTALAQVDAGLLSLDAPVTDYLPAFRPALPDGSVPVITVRHLITHTSGLSYPCNEEEGSDYHRAMVPNGMDQPDLSIDEAIARISSVALRYVPGTDWRYSVSMDVLGFVVGAAEGSDLAEVFGRRIAQPLGLKDLGFGPIPEAGLAKAYRSSDAGPVPIADGDEMPMGPSGNRFVPSRYHDAGAYASGGSSAWGTATDVARLLDTVRQGGAPVLSAEAVAAMTRSQVPETRDPGWAHGMGFGVLTDPAVAGWDAAPGVLRWGGAYGHTFFVDPARRLSVVALTNSAGEGSGGRFPVELRRAVLSACRAMA